MLASGAPTKIQKPFADTGTKNTVPVASQIGITNGAASYTDGFPPLTFLPVASGGVPPFGEDFNGILNAITTIQQFQSAGGVFAYDAAQSTAVGGYPKNAKLAKASGIGYWTSLVDNNTTNPDTGGAGWVDLTNTITPTLYGALADGVTDDYAAFAAAAATGLPIDLRGKTYKLNTNTTIALTAPMRNGTIIVGTAYTGYVFSSTGDFNGLDRVKFTGGSSVLGVPIIILGASTNFFVTNCRMDTFPRGGIVAQGGSTGGIIHGNRLNACSVLTAPNEYGAITSNAVYTLINNNVIVNCATTAISCTAVNNVIISNNTTSGDGVSTTSGSLLLDGASRSVAMVGNSIYNCAVEGIMVAGNIGVYGSATFDIVIANNAIVECGTSGITLQGADAGSVKNVTISGNTIRKAAVTTSAIQVQHAYYVEITGNWVGGYLNGVDPILSSQNINVVGNSFIGQGGKGISAEASNSVISGNLVSGTLSASDGIFYDCTLATDVLIANNVIQNCLVGLRAKFSATASAYVKNNHFPSNATHLVYTTPQPNSSFGNTFGDMTLAGTATLVAGTVTVANIYVAAGDRIEIFRTTPGGTVGALFLSTITAATSFVITSTSSTDTSTISWRIIR